jgi:CDP-diacylglycerol---glycerol-3-phosphate 3-phosphatidyltransferase
MTTGSNTARDVRSTVFNFPNQLTSLRLLLSVVMFGFIAQDWYLTSFVLFVIAAGTDWLDGYYARKYGQVTTLGRILDPFADKVIVCGTFVFLIADKNMQNVPGGLRAGMVGGVVARGMLGTALRSFIEDRGSDFSAKMSGKLKMVLQCIAAGTCLFYLYRGKPPADHLTDWIWWVLIVFVWSSVVLTIYSGLVYIGVAVRLLRADTK